MFLSEARRHAELVFEHASVRWLFGWWRILHLGAMLLVVALAPKSYDAETRRALARHVYLGTAPMLAWFTSLSALFGLVLIRIVVVTAESYGLSQYALEMVVRVLVLELLPLTTALFVALRYTLPMGVEVAAMRRTGAFGEPGHENEGALRLEVLPRVVAGIFAVWMLAAASAVTALLLAYLSVYGFQTAGFPAYTHTVGQVFDGVVSMVLLLKLGFLSIAVAGIPIASALEDRIAGGGRTGPELQALIRLFVAVLLIEVVSLVGNYG